MGCTRRRHRARPSWARWRRRPSGRRASKRPSDADALPMRWMCACAGVRAAWGQAWSYGCERARVPAATEAVPNAGDGGSATTTRGRGQLRSDEKSGRRVREPCTRRRWQHGVVCERRGGWRRSRCVCIACQYPTPGAWERRAAAEEGLPREAGGRGGGDERARGGGGGEGSCTLPLLRLLLPECIGRAT
jgi:hypothetical protein